VVYEKVKLTQEFRTFDFLSPWEGMLQLPGDEKAGKADGRDPDQAADHEFRAAASRGPWRAAPGHGDGWRGRRASRPAYRPAPSRNREADSNTRPICRRSPISIASITSRPCVRSNAFVLAVEKLLGLEVPLRAQYIRVMFDEITRILNHLLKRARLCADVGALTPFLWCFEERELLMEFYGGSAARACMRRIIGRWVHQDLPAGLLDDVLAWTNRFPKVLDDIEYSADREPHLQAAAGGYRQGFGRRCAGLGFTGPMLRASGLAWDLRKSQPYMVYGKMNFDIRSARTATAMIAISCAWKRCARSIRIIASCIAEIPRRAALFLGPQDHPPPRAEMKRSMEALIHHFKLYTEASTCRPGEDPTRGGSGSAQAEVGGAS